MAISFSPKAGDPKYAPHRDLAYLTPTLMRAAVMALDPDNLSAADREYMSQNQVTEQDLGLCIERLVAAQNQFVASLDAKHVDDVLRHAQFDECSHATRTLVFAAFGRALVGAWFQAVRDVTHIGDVPAEQDNMSRFYAVALRIAGQLRDVSLTSAEQAVAIADRLSQERVHLQMRLSAQAEALTKCRQQLSAGRAAMQDLAVQNIQLGGRITELETPWYKRLVNYVFTKTSTR